MGTSDGNASQNNWEAIHVQLDHNDLLAQLSFKYRDHPAEHHTNTEHLGKLLVLHCFSSSSVSGYISPSASVKEKAQVTALEAGQYPKREFQSEELRKFKAKKWSKFRKYLF